MRLARRTLLRMGTVLACLLGALYVVSWGIMMDGFLELEEREAARNVDRVTNAVAQAGESLNTKLSDWASWDDTYTYIQDHNEAYVSSNLTDEGMAMLRLSVRFFLDKDGRLVSGRGFDLRSGRGGELPDGMMTLIRARHPVLRHEKDAGAKYGLLTLPEGVMLIASQPILTSKRMGPGRGTLVFGRWLDSLEISRLGMLTKVNLSMYALGDDEMPEDCRWAEARVLGRDSPIRRIDADSVAGYTVLPDATGAPALVARVQMGREIYQRGVATLRYFLVSLAAAGVVFGTVSIVALRGLVLSRLERLSGEVAQITASGERADRVSVSGDDELGTLACCINDLLAAQERQAGELNRRAWDLNEVQSKAASASRIKSEFLANMSHEIRTPMTAIIGYADLLLDPAQTPTDREEAVHTIQRNSHHLLAIINDILDLSKIEAGSMTIERVECSPIQVVEEVVSLMRRRGAANVVPVEIQHEYPLPATIRTDPARLRQVLENLLGNAIKFTERGSVRVVTRLASTGPGVGALCYDVVDKGIGMTEEEVRRLFRPLSESDTSVSRRSGGTGLGLAICRRLAALMDGDVTVKSRPGEGSTFTLRLACDLEGTTMIQRPRSEREGATGSQSGTPAELTGRVLLAADGTDSQPLVAHVLRRAGAEVTVAGNGPAAADEALDAAADGRPFDVIVMDMQVPVLDGYAVARLLRRKGYEGPIVALAAHGMDEDGRRCLDAGCDDYLTKPVEKAQLLETCARWANAGRVKAARDAA